MYICICVCVCKYNMDGWDGWLDGCSWFVVRGWFVGLFVVRVTKLLGGDTKKSLPLPPNPFVKKETMTGVIW